ncbi:MAG: hypothetical protein PHN31_04300 [Candidatus Gracilibacteria bacterium]|nr:hypothetical protein [Candidatus Gracilibacteria bacterium]
MVKIGTRDEYREVKGKIGIYGQDNCPFCDLESQKDHVIWKGKHWYILHNMFPYSGNEKHIMAVPYEHKKVGIELIDEEILELKDIYKFMEEWFGDENYFSCTRESMGNRSVEHYHMHFIPGRLQGKYLRKMLENQGYLVHQELDINEKKYVK